ncbi:MAG: type I 3-dehydroquinate dehydratase [Candidatus Kerfeldbacteria bacterium]|nr:type I 3-dehydroquinate dehydratase [Candidatus Kerfeldbacteria bacterium]
MIAVSLTRPQDYQQALRSGADYVELRTDYFTDQQLKHFVEHSTLPVIYTIKRPTAYLPKVAYVDIDDQSKQHLSGKVIRSFHDYKRTPHFSTLNQLVQSILKQKSIPKIATHVQTVADLYTLARLQKKYGKKIIVVGMGELGMMTRVYNKSLLTYASVSRAATTATGQLTMKEMKTTQLFGLVGDAIQHSLSPKLHQQFYRQKHLPYDYQLWETVDLAKMMFVFDFFELPGASVTKPFKRQVMQYCDQIDRHAKKIGAVNTVVRRGNTLLGYNTDWLGVQNSIGRYLTGKRVLILGRGGTAKAIAYAAKQAGSKKITMLGHQQLPTSTTDYDVVVNATPVGDQLLVPANSLKGKVVMDCIYGQQTELLKQARYNGAKVVLDGLPMLRYQATEQFRLMKV